MDLISTIPVMGDDSNSLDRYLRFQLEVARKSEDLRSRLRRVVFQNIIEIRYLFGQG